MDELKRPTQDRHDMHAKSQSGMRVTGDWSHDNRRVFVVVCRDLELEAGEPTRRPRWKYSKKKKTSPSSVSYGLSATAKCLPRTVRLAERDGPGPCSSDSSNRVPTLRLPPRARRRAARQPAESPERRWPSQSQGQTADKQEHGARTCEAARAGGSRGRDRAPIFRVRTAGHEPCGEQFQRNFAASSSRAMLLYGD